MFKIRCCNYVYVFAFRSEHIDVNFDIDMRTFANFKLHQQEELEEFLDLENGSPERIILTEEFVSENQSIFVISTTISQFLQSQTQSGLRVFNPGLFIIDRQNPNDDLRHGSHLKGIDQDRRNEYKSSGSKISDLKN